MMSTNIFMTTQFIKEVRRQVMPFYLPTTYKNAFDWLAQQKNDGAVLSEFVTGNFIPAYSGHPSFMGHSSFTPEILMKKNESAQFYRNPNCSFLQKSNIRYVFWGNEEKNKNGTNFKLNWPVVYRSNQIMIFEMPPSGACWK